MNVAYFCTLFLRVLRGLHSARNFYYLVGQQTTNEAVFRLVGFLPKYRIITQNRYPTVGYTLSYWLYAA